MCTWVRLVAYNALSHDSAAVSNNLRGNRRQLVTVHNRFIQLDTSQHRLVPLLVLRLSPITLTPQAELRRPCDG